MIFPTRESFRTPDWPGLLEPGETLLWAGRPNLLIPLLMVGIGLAGLHAEGPVFLPVAVPLAIPLFLVAHDAYALTDHRILTRNHPFFGKPRLRSLSRAGTWANPLNGFWRGAMTSTTPDCSRIRFPFLSWKTTKYLVALYAAPKGVRP
ncbi:MAG: hypothetical protein LBE86_01450 [Gemmobacter sp.]|jgi:hypothetical protein|nr:hypothetical protein [Gemmobacter sp.]